LSTQHAFYIATYFAQPVRASSLWETVFPIVSILLGRSLRLFHPPTRPFDFFKWFRSLVPHSTTKRVFGALFPLLFCCSWENLQQKTLRDLRSLEGSEKSISNVI